MSPSRRRGLLWLVAAGVALPVLVFAALYLPPVQRLLVDRALDTLRASANLDIQASRVRFSPARLSLTADDVRVAAVGSPDAPLLEAQRVELDIARTTLTSRGQHVALDRLSLSSPTVLVRRAPDGSWNLPATDPTAEPSPLPHVTLDAVRVTDARVIVDDRVADVRLVVDGLTLTGSGRHLEAAGAVDLALPDDATLAGRLDATLSYDAGVLGIQEATLRTGESALQVQGAVDVEDGDLDLSATLDAQVGDIAPVAGLPEAQGTLLARVTATGPVDAPRGTWSIDARDLTDGAAPAVTLEAHGTADTAHVRAEALTATVLGGRLTAPTAVLGLEPTAETRLHLELDGLRLARLLDAYAPATSLAAHVSATLHARGPGLDWRAWRSSAEVRLRPDTTVGTRAAGVAPHARSVPLDGLVEARVADGRWQAEGNVAIPDVVVAVADLRGRLADALPESTLDGRVRLDADDLRAATTSLADTSLAIDGRASLAARLSGTVAAPRATWTLDATASSPWTEPADVTASGRLTVDEVIVEALTATAGPNRVDGTLTAALTEAQRVTGRFEANVPAIDALLRPAATGGWALTGRASASARLSGSLPHPVAAFTLEAQALDVAGQHVDSLTTQGAFRDSIAQVERLEARAGPGRLSGEGRVDVERLTHQARVSIDDWPIRPWPSPPASAPTPEPAATPLTATLGAQLETRGPLDRPTGTATIDLDDVTWSGHPVTALTAHASSDGTAVSATFTAPGLRTSGKGTVTLDRPLPFDVSATIDGLTLDPLRPWLPAPWNEATARLSAELAAAGQATDPLATTTVRLMLETLTATLDEATVSIDTPARVVASADAVSVSDLRLRTGSLVADVDGQLARGAADSPASAGVAGATPLTVRVSGGLDALRPWAAALDAPLPALTGQVDLRAEVAGTLDQPRPGATLTLTDASVDLADNALRVPNATMQIRDGVVTLDETTATWRGGQATVSGRLPLRLFEEQVPDAMTPWLGTAGGPARLDARAVGLQPDLLEPFVGADALENITGSMSATLTARASGPSLADVTGTLTLDEARATLQGITLAQARPTIIELEGGALRVTDALFSGANTDLAIDGVAQLTGDDPSLDAQLRGLTDLALLQPFLDDVATAGRAEIDLRAQGALTAPEVTGQLILTDVSVRVAEPRLVIEQLDGTATFSGRQMTLPSLRGLANGAPLTVSAALALSPENVPGGQVRVRAEGVPLEYPEGLRVEANVDLLASLAEQRVDLTGDVAILRGAYRDPIALSALSTALLATDAPDFDAVAAGTESAYDVRFDIDVETREEILMDNNYGRLAIGGNLRVLGTLEQPALSGRITVEEGGELYLAGLTYRVERGVVDFANPTRIEPIVDLAAETRAGGERIRIEASGTPDELEVTLSAPEAYQPLSQAELASLLVSGRGLDEFSGTAAGEQVLTLLSADLFGLIGRGVGLDAIRLDRELLLDDRAGTGEVDVAAETDPVARLTIVKRLRSDVEVLFSQNLRDANAITWLVTWRPLRPIEVRLLQRDDRSISYEFRHEIVFDAPPARARSRETPPRITEVIIEVDDASIRTALRDALDLEAGDRFDFYRWMGDRDRLAAWLYDHRYYEHRVTARRDVHDGDDGPTVTLVYDVRTGPQGTLIVTGAPLGEDVRNRMREAWRGSVFDGFLAVDLTRIAREALLAVGHPLATIDVRTQLEDEGRRKQTTVAIDPGPSLATDLDTVGVAASLSTDFSTWLETGSSRLAWLDAPALASRARDWLRGRGALRADVAVSDPEVAGDRVVRTLRVTNGEVFTLRRIDVEGVADARVAAARDQLGLSAGDPVVTERIATATRELERWYLSEGFRTVEVETTSTVREDAGVVDLAIEVNEGARAIVVATHIDGREHTQRAIFERALSLPLGATVTPTNLLTARKRLYDTGVVASADVRVDDSGPVEVQPDGTRLQPVTVTGVVRERPRLRLRYGLAVNDDVLQDDAFRATSSRRVTPGLAALLENRNLFGRAIMSGLSARYERARQLGRAFLSSPRLFGYDARLQASTGIARSRLTPDMTDSPIDLRTDVSVGVTQGLPGLEGLRLTYGYRYERSRTYDPQNPDLFDITITAPRLTSTGYIDRRDDAAVPTRGWFHASTLELSRNWVGSDFNFLKYYVQQSAFRSIGEVVLAGRVQVGLGRGFGGQDLIGSERFSAGGAVSVRGYGESVIGEVDPILGIARGDGLVVLNGEVRVPIWRWISGVGFIDAGGVYPRVGDLSISGLRWGTGGGLRVSTPAGLMRVDLGVPLDPRAIDKTWRVYVGLGQIF